MKYKKFGNKIIVRIDRGEEILEKIKEVALAENIKLASLSALGAVDKLTVGVFAVTDKKYYSNTFEGNLEIVSLTGTISTMNGEYYPHLHISVGDDQGRVFGGHLNEARISATCELVIDIIDGEIDRKLNDEVGLNLIDFGD